MQKRREQEMSVRMKKELIEGGMQLRAAPQQFAVEAEAALPGGLRDEVRLFYTEAQAEPAQPEVPQPDAPEQQD